MASPENSHTPSGEGTGESSQDPSPGGSGAASRGGSEPPKKKGIHWQSEGESMATKKQKARFNVRDHSEPVRDEPPKALPKAKRRRDSTHSRGRSPMSKGDFSESVTDALKKLPASKPSILRRNSSDISENGYIQMKGGRGEDEIHNMDEQSFGKAVAQRTAQSKVRILGSILASFVLFPSRKVCLESLSWENCVNFNAYLNGELLTLNHQ